jgi:formate hydrogenlyase subunit 4
VTGLAGIVALVLHAVLMVAAAPLLVGLVRWTKARLLGRVGASILQPWRDMRRLVRKQPVVAEGASWVFTTAPIVSLAAVAAAALLVPSFTLGMATAPAADLIVLGGLFAASRCAMALAGMDIGTAFGGIGASRSMTFAVFAEPAFLLVIFTLALLASTTNLVVIAGLLREGAFGLRVSLALVLIAMVMVALVETGRLPADNPATHLELTMVHEAQVLEYSGWHLAMIEMASALKLLVWLSLLAVLFVPAGIAGSGGSPVAWATGLVVWGAKIGVMAIALAVFETGTAKMRVFRVPEFLGVALLLGLLAAVLLFVSQGFA